MDVDVRRVQALPSIGLSPQEHIDIRASAKDLVESAVSGIVLVLFMGAIDDDDTSEAAKVRLRHKHCCVEDERFISIVRASSRV